MFDKLNYEPSRLSPVLWKIICYCLSLLVIELATVTYGVIVFILLYYTYVPTVKLERALDLVFNTDCNLSMGHPYVCSFPTANFSVSENGVPLLTPNYPYMLLLNLWLPDSTHNLYAGMGIITLELFNREHVLIQQFRKPFTLPYRSKETRIISNILFLPMYMIGRMKEEVLLPIEMSSSFQFDVTQPVLGGRVVLESRHHVWSALELKIQTTLSGFQSLLYHYPQVSFITCIFVVSLLMNTIYVSLILLYTLWVFFKTPTTPKLPKIKDEPKTEDDQLYGETQAEENSFPN
ncbi:Seipin [Schistosoma japonicum]|uniref:Seipin n=2 Tax=Schistosoma japonicum TaxID=6182 RepID=Q86FG4_SCHJA|nr:similar to GenBank Accession Number AB030196 contains transmembrane (TM) region in Mus musculus [Schistosoma japonicum]TNN07629.1 Seipin [Schistosoma japonicum]TNN07630.1 Seipin [Schistosoma japonicum]